MTNKTSKKKQEAEDNRKEDNSYILDEEHELHKLKLRFRKAGALSSRKSEEQLEYEEIKARIKEYEIKRSEYEQLRDDHPPLHLPKDPKTYFRTKYVWTNWYDFLGVDTKKFIQSKQEWIKFCKDKNVSTLEDYEDLCKECDKLPPHPGDFYDDFTNVGNELEFKRQRRH